MTDFRSQGIDYDIEHGLRKQLNADHRYLHIGYVRLKHGKKWGEWTIPRIEKYHAMTLLQKSMRKSQPPEHKQERGQLYD
jgi:hypothetical protein